MERNTGEKTEGDEGANWIKVQKNGGEGAT
jgi:hypothetical protein